jgi:hypothetical protein
MERVCSGFGRAGLVACIALSGFSACKEERARPKFAPEPAPASAEVLPQGPVSGKIRDQVFKLGNARYYVDRRLGYEKVDIKLSAGTSEEPCGQVTPKDSTMVWLRRTGPEPLTATEARVEPDQPGPWEAHYQVRGEHNWEGNGDASALIVIREVSPDMTLHGELKACFGDAEKSCVAGKFDAKYCPIRIDSPVRGTEAMERPPPGDAGWSWFVDAGEIEGGSGQAPASGAVDAGLVDAAVEPKH